MDNDFSDVGNVYSNDPRFTSDDWTSHIDDAMHRQTCLQRHFPFRGIDLQVTVQAEIAEHGDLQLVKAPRDGAKSLGIHAAFNRCNKW